MNHDTKLHESQYKIIHYGIFLHFELLHSFRNFIFSKFSRSFVYAVNIKNVVITESLEYRLRSHLGLGLRLSIIVTDESMESDSDAHLHGH